MTQPAAGEVIPAPPAPLRLSGRTAMTDRPSVLYACIHNSGRSVAAQVLTRHYAGDAVSVRSAGSQPGTASRRPLHFRWIPRGWDNLGAARTTPSRVEGVDERSQQRIPDATGAVLWACC